MGQRFDNRLLNARHLRISLCFDTWLGFSRVAWSHLLKRKKPERQQLHVVLRQRVVGDLAFRGRINRGHLRWIRRRNRNRLSLRIDELYDRCASRKVPPLEVLRTISGVGPLHRTAAGGFLYLAVWNADKS